MEEIQAASHSKMAVKQFTERFVLYWISLSFAILAAAIQTAPSHQFLAPILFEFLGWVSLALMGMLGLRFMGVVGLQLSLNAQLAIRREKLEGMPPSMEGIDILVPGTTTGPMQQRRTAASASLDEIEKAATDLDHKMMGIFDHFLKLLPLALFCLMISRGYSLVENYRSQLSTNSKETQSTINDQIIQSPVNEDALPSGG